MQNDAVQVIESVVPGAIDLHRREERMPARRGVHFCRDASRDASIKVELFQYYNNTTRVQIRRSRGRCTTMGRFNQCVGGKNLPVVSASYVFQVVIKVRN